MFGGHASRHKLFPLLSLKKKKRFLPTVKPWSLKHSLWICGATSNLVWKEEKKKRFMTEGRLVVDTPLAAALWDEFMDEVQCGSCTPIYFMYCVLKRKFPWGRTELSLGHRVQSWQCRRTSSRYQNFSPPSSIVGMNGPQLDEVGQRVIMGN